MVKSKDLAIFVLIGEQIICTVPTKLCIYLSFANMSFSVEKNLQSYADGQGLLEDYLGEQTMR